MGNYLEKAEIPWHPGFYGAMELELAANKGWFEFHREYNLGKEPLRMDLLIIRKLSGVPVRNEIGHIFKTYNIAEFKNPGDGLSIDDYYKTMGYACLYKGLGEKVGQIPAEELTISIFRDRYPRKLFHFFKQAGHVVEEACPGIYYVKAPAFFDTQIIVTSRLRGASHKSLRLLSTKAREADVKAFITEAVGLRDPGDRNNVEAVLQVSIAANQELFDEIRRQSEMCDALKNLMKDLMEEELDEARKRGRQEGLETGRQEGQENSLLETIKNLMLNMKWTADQAMSAMNIPAEKRNIYKAKL